MKLALALTLAVFAVALRIGDALEPRLRTRWARAAGWAIVLLLTLPSLAFAGYYAHLVDEPVHLYRFRAVVGSELVAGLSGLAIGWTASLVRRARGATRTPFAIHLAAGAAIAVIAMPYAKNLLLPLDASVIEQRWWDGVCMQSTLATCGPSCAATLLRASGRPGDEASLAADANTSASGTECWYLARALRRRGLAVELRAQPASLPCPAPAIAGVRLGGSGHFIALIARDADGRLEVGDPTLGRRRMGDDELRRRYALTGFFLVVTPGE